MSIIRTNQITNTAGDASPNIPGGVLQVLQAQKEAVQTVSAGNNAGVISQVITPKYSNSKILVRCCLHIGSGDNAYGYGRLVRQISGQSSSFIGLSTIATGSQINASFQVMTKNWTYQGFRTSPHIFEYLDSPNTTLATTYEINLACTSDNVYLNRSATVVTDNVWTPATMSTLTLMEIGA